MEKTEYRVKPVVRWVVTQHKSDPDKMTASVQTLGLFENEGFAEEVARKMGLADAHCEDRQIPKPPSIDEQIRQNALMQRVINESAQRQPSPLQQFVNTARGFE